MFSVTVKIEGIESRRRSAGLLHIVSGFYLLAKSMDYLRLLQFEQVLPVVPPLIVVVLSLGYGFFRRRVDPLARHNGSLRLLQLVAFTFLSIAFMNGGKTIDYAGTLLFTLLTLLLLFSERRIFQETTIYFSSEGVKIPGIYRDHLIPWTSLTDVVVREDFLTLFHVQKKYLQFQVRQDLSTLEVAKMNAYCREQLGLIPTASEPR
jgi:hypothetical protein